MLSAMASDVLYDCMSMNEGDKRNDKRKSSGMMFESIAKRDGGFDFHSRNAPKKKENPVDLETGPRIVVVGVGGGGGNTVEHLINSGDLDDIKMAVLNTDMQDLSKSSCKHKVQIGPAATQGLGAGGNPENGAVAAEESMKEIMGIVEDAHMLFLICGEGGGTGTGTIPVVAKAAREAGILTIGVVTRPFTFEGKKRAAVAEAGVAKLQENLDLLIVIPNDNVLRISDQSTAIADAFKAVDDVAAALVRSFARLVKKIGLLNIDFADIKAALSGMQARGMVGVGEVEVDSNGSGVHAAEKALLNPLLEEYSLYGARSVIMSIEMGRNVSIDDINGATSRVQDEINEDNDNPCKFVFGATYDDELDNKIRVTIIGAVNENSAQLLHQAKNDRMSEELLRSKAKSRDLDEDFIVDSGSRRHAALNEEQAEFTDDEFEEDWPQRSSNAPEPQQEYISRPRQWWRPHFTESQNSIGSVRFVDEAPRKGGSRLDPKKR